MGLRKTTEQFIEDVKAVHGDKYDYSLVEYVDWKTKVKVICNLCNNIFEISPNNHIRERGCRQCGIKRRVKASRMKLEEFIRRAKEKHGDKYDYSKVDYINNRDNVVIVCPIHADFKQSVSNHLAGQGCSTCGKKVTAEKTSLTNEIFIERSNIKHNNFYDYSKVNYTSGKNKVSIGCPVHKEYFEQEASSHINGSGCPKCALELDSYRRSHYTKLAETSTLYLIEVYNDEESFYKIGKTIHEVKKRFSGKKKLPYNYKLVKEYNSEIGEIYDLEIELHRKYKQFQYFPKIYFGGYCECYTTQLPIQEIISLGCQRK